MDVLQDAPKAGGCCDTSSSCRLVCAWWDTEKPAPPGQLHPLGFGTTKAPQGDSPAASENSWLWPPEQAAAHSSGHSRHTSTHQPLVSIWNPSIRMFFLQLMLNYSLCPVGNKQTPMAGMVVRLPEAMETSTRMMSKCAPTYLFWNVKRLLGEMCQATWLCEIPKPNQNTET